MQEAFYILDGKALVECTEKEWNMWRQKHCAKPGRLNVHIANNELNRHTVYTYFQGEPFAYKGSEPLCFETDVISDELEWVEMTHHTTYDAALKGHQAMVEKYSSE